MFAVVIASLLAFTNAAKAQNPTQDIPVVGTIAGGGTFAGTLDIQRFTSKNGQLVAIGSLTGTLTNALGVVIGTVTNRGVRLPVTNVVGTCEILDLDLGAIHLNLLGLVVDLAPVHLDIIAVPGALLGDLLCAVSNLLSGGGPLGSLATLLNNILRILG